MEKTANYFIQELLRIYPCKIPFEILVIDKKPKTRMGVYIVDKKRIRIYSGWGKEHDMMETAIHEYAHHIHFTEQYTGATRGVDRAHGLKFWRIYSALMAVAMKRGIFDDPLIEDIIMHSDGFEG